MSDTVPDIEPDARPSVSVTAPTVSGPNSFFIFLLSATAFLLMWRVSWEAVKIVVKGQVRELLFWIWLIPVAGILGSVLVPSLGTTAVWFIACSSVAAAPIVLAAIYIMIWGAPASSI
jgi:hypothetical protein